MSNLPGAFSAQRLKENVFCTAAVGGVEKRLPVLGPHGPTLLGIFLNDSLVGAVFGDVFQPDFGFIEMAVAVPPPLGGTDAFGDEGELPAIGRRRAAKLVVIAISRHFERRTAIDAYAKDVVCASDVIAVGSEVEPFAIPRPCIKELGRIAVGEPGELTGGERQDVDISVSGSGGGEGKLGAIGRIKGARFGGGMRDEETRFPAFCGDGPNITAGDESDFGAVGRERRFAERGTRGNCACKGSDRETGRESSDEADHSRV